MATHFKLSRELLGHSKDVRAVAVLPSGHIVTGSRDNTIKIWNTDNLSQTKTLTAHQNFVGALTTLTPNEEAPTRILASGGHDRVVCVWDISADIDATNNNNNSNTNTNNTDASPINFMIGHENAVTSISATVDGDIISGSWDKTVRIWKFGTCVQELKGHEHAVWAVLGLPNGDIVTASADSTIKIWRGTVGSMQCVKTLKEHKDCVRGLALIPGIGFVSCANDETLIVWSMGGDPVQILHGHTAYVYSVDVLRVAQDNYLIISGSEDRTLKVWKDGECVQTITHPSGVWCVAAAQDAGEIVTGCADGVARTWTQNTARLADPETIQTYEANVASSSVHKSAVGDLDLSKLPGPEALQQKRGTKDGEHLIVKTAAGGAELHSWSLAEGKWIKIGDVVDSSKGGKETLYGKEYDYVFDIDAEGSNRKLGYNTGENPYVVAQEFINREEINQEFLDQVAKFIIQNANTGTMTLGGPAPASDPLTGGNRYIPGSSSSSSSSSSRPQSDAFTGSNRYVPYAPPTSSNPTISNTYFPQQTMTAYEGGNLAGLQQKLTEFSAIVNPPLAPEDQAQINALMAVLKDTARYHSTKVSEDQLRIIIKKMLVWPPAQLLPVLDLLRLLFTHSYAAAILGSIKTTPSLFEILLPIASDITVPTNSMLALRCFANMFKITGARKIIEANQSAIMDMLLIAIGSDNKNVAHSAATITLNFTVLYRTQPNEAGIARIAAVLAKALALPTLAPDSQLRCVIAAGTLAANPAGFALARMHFAGLLPPLCASTEKDLGPAARALAQSLV